jgi:ribosomal protein S18 acetylase RimI-like enzyme
VTERTVIEVRKAARLDEEAVRRCVAEAYEVYRLLMGKMPAPTFDDYATLIASGVTHVAVIEGAIVGVLVAWPEADHFYVDNVAVDPAHQGAGIGHRLLERADELARDEGRGELRLYTNEAMEYNLGYYPRQGFTETHRGVDDGYRRVYFSRSVPALQP